MLALSEMKVVFVYREKITYSSFMLTAKIYPKGNYGYIFIKCHSDESILKNIEWNEVNPASEKLKFGRGTT